MKRSFIAVAVIALAVIGSYAMFAQAQPPGRGMMQGRGMMDNGMMCPMCPMMAGAMMQKALVATEDGGVVVLMGDRLVKFDAQLKQVQEAEIPFDMERMQQKIQQMMQNCPMHQQMMQSRQGQPNTDSSPQARAPGAGQTPNP
jgi:hypothetical protein